MALTLDAASIENLLLGGALLGGGGGGSLEEGRRWAMLALERGRPRLVEHDELTPDALVATVSAVGAPAARHRFTTADDFVRAVEHLQENLDAPLAGLVTSENGGAASANGLVQSAALGLPVVDAPCNGRAHPTGVMGSMGLERLPGFVSRQVAVGGDPALARHLELFVAAPLSHADALIRTAAVQAGGMVAVARNPVRLDYIRAHGAPGALRLALRLGERMRAAMSLGGPAVAADVVAGELAGRVLATDVVRDLQLETRGGYDVGGCRVGACRLTFWNEFMTVECDGTRLATFPDLITVLDRESGKPVASAELRAGQPAILVSAPRSRLILGAGVRDPDNLRAIEVALGVPIVESTC